MKLKYTLVSSKVLLEFSNSEKCKNIDFFRPKLLKSSFFGQNEPTKLGPISIDVIFAKSSLNILNTYFREKNSKSLFFMTYTKFPNN